MTGHSSIPPRHAGPIILVDDEVELVRALDHALRGRFGAERVKTTSNPNQALEWVHQEKPGVLITDTLGAGLSGLELAAAARDTWGPTPTIVIAEQASDEVRRGARQGSFRYLTKPISARQLLDTVEQLEAAPPSSFSGAITISTLTDLLQLYALSGSTGLVQVRSGERRGSIWFERGQISHAHSGALQGFDAFCEILRWPKGSFSWQSRRTEVRTIAMSASELMLEALRIQDEQALAMPASSAPPPASFEDSCRSTLPSIEPLSEPIDAPSAPIDPPSTLPSGNRPPPTYLPRALEPLSGLGGFVGAALVDSDSGVTLELLGGDERLDLRVASAGNTMVMRAKRQVVNALDMSDEIEDILITLPDQYHLMRPLRTRPTVFLYLAVERGKTNLALARLVLAEVERGVA